MPVQTDLPTLYRRPINVWVEDSLTSEYLQELWREPRALLLIAGATGSVKPAVQDAARNGASNVFGIVDRDFENTNRQRWENAQLRCFVVPAHEMENYLLDEYALAGCDLNNRSRSAVDILARMRDRAKGLLLWMAVCHTLKRVRRYCLDDYPQRPSATKISTLNEAWQFIEQSPWFQSFSTRAADIAAPATVRGWLSDAFASLDHDLATDDWKQTFSGKEILRDIRGFIYQPPQPAPPSVHDVDLAQSVARWQADNGRVPNDLMELLRLLRTKAGV